MSDPLSRIQQRSYWRIVVRPTRYQGDLCPSLASLEESVRLATVEIRGWDYPHWPKEALSRHQDGVEARTDWEEHKEVWKAFRSGQFIHYLALREDWLDENSFFAGKIPSGRVLGYESTIYTLTEIFLFAARWSAGLKLGPAVRMELMLTGLKNRRLYTFDPSRMPFGEYRKASTSQFEFAEEFAPESLIATPETHALPVMRRLFELLDWDTTTEHLETVQRKLLTNRL
jgi:hypothetical protein